MALEAFVAPGLLGFTWGRGTIKKCIEIMPEGRAHRQYTGIAGQRNKEKS
jgi:hypothetical protein